MGMMVWEDMQNLQAHGLFDSWFHHLILLKPLVYNPHPSKPGSSPASRKPRFLLADLMAPLLKP